MFAHDPRKNVQHCFQRYLPKYESNDTPHDYFEKELRRLAKRDELKVDEGRMKEAKLMFNAAKWTQGNAPLMLARHMQYRLKVDVSHTFCVFVTALCACYRLCDVANIWLFFFLRCASLCL